MAGDRLSTPAELWSGFWATARLDLHLSDEDFFDLTPRQFDVLCRRYKNTRERDREHTELLFSQLTSWVANTGFHTPEKPTKATDFMPSRWGTETRKSTPQAKRMTKTRRAAVASELQLIFPR